MRLCVLSDTHIPDRYDALPAALLETAKHCDLIIHAGDFTSWELYTQLRALNDLKAVRGNIDAPQIQASLKEKDVFRIGPHKIGLIHGFGRPDAVLENVKKSFSDPLDLVIFGHTHAAFCEKIGKTLYFNPGSPTDKIFSAENSYGIIEIDKEIVPRIIKC